MQCCPLLVVIVCVNAVSECPERTALGYAGGRQPCIPKYSTRLVGGGQAGRIGRFGSLERRAPTLVSWMKQFCSPCCEASEIALVISAAPCHDPLRSTHAAHDLISACVLAARCRQAAVGRAPNSRWLQM